VPEASMWTSGLPSAKFSALFTFRSSRPRGTFWSVAKPLPPARSSRITRVLQRAGADRVDRDVAAAMLSLAPVAFNVFKAESSREEPATSDRSEPERGGRGSSAAAGEGNWPVQLAKLMSCGELPFGLMVSPGS